MAAGFLWPVATVFLTRPSVFLARLGVNVSLRLAANHTDTVGAGSHPGPDRCYGERPQVTDAKTAPSRSRLSLRLGTAVAKNGDCLRIKQRQGAQQGITLVELLVAMAIIGLMLAITFPSFTAGLDGIVLRSDIDRAGSFFNQARLQADRLQQPVQLTADPGERKLTAISVDGAWEESFALNERCSIVFPKEKQSVILHPGTPAPRFRLLLQSERGASAGLQINIFTGVPEDWSPGQEDTK